MINGYPTKKELERRILRQIEWRGKSTEVSLLWRGYLSGLLEWGVVEVSTYDDLLKLLPPVGAVELYELFADEPITAEQEQDVIGNVKKC
jgi:hypothetical protein